MKASKKQLDKMCEVKLTNAVDLEQGGVLTLDTTVGEMIDGLRLFS